jgi:signal transduction histidine kinase
LLVVAMVTLLAQQMLERVQVEELLLDLERAHRQVRAHAARIEDLTIVQERARLAHELHDSLGHTLTALDVQVELLARLPQSAELARQAAANQARGLVKQALTEVRSSVAALRPAALQKVDAHATIAALVRDFARTTGLPVTWTLTGAPQPLPPAATLLIYRAAQEALTNVQRHAPTTSGVQVHLTFAPPDVTLRVENQPPVTPAEPSPFSGCAGLPGLHDRAIALGGAFTATPLPAGGFRLELRLPLG